MSKDCNVKRYSGVGGQAVMEGVMMKNKDEYAVAVRKSDGEIEIMKDTYKGVWGGNAFTKLPFIRGVFSFIDSLVLGMKTLTYSASFFEEEEEKDKEKNKKNENLLMGLTVAFSVVMAVVIFMLLPYGLSRLLKMVTDSEILIAIAEGVLRMVIFLAYVSVISLMEDIKRVYMYHGAEHKCINCIEDGFELTVENVRKSSRLHRRCGTSFMLFVVVISVIVFMFIRSDVPYIRLGLRVVLIPVIAGISYELLRLAGRCDNIIIRILSAPGLALQKITTAEPDDSMIEVGIKAVEAVFDYKTWQAENEI